MGGTNGATLVNSLRDDYYYTKFERSLPNKQKPWTETLRDSRVAMSFQLKSPDEPLVTSSLERKANYFSKSWNAALRRISSRRRRMALEFSLIARIIANTQ